MTPIAEQILDTLRATQQTFQENEEEFLDSNKAKLLSNGRFSCALLDAAFTLAKIIQTGGAPINVINREYKKQQAKVRAILKQLNEPASDTPFQQFYVNTAAYNPSKND